MPDGDYPAAKLREQLRAGDVDDVRPHAGLVGDDGLEAVMSFADAVVDDWRDSRLCAELTATKATRQASRAIEEDKSSLLGFLSGIREQDFDTSEVRGLMQLLTRLRRNGYLSTFFGRTDGGKTNVALLMAELAMHDDDSVHLVTNISSVRSSVPESRYHFADDFSTAEKTIEMLAEFDQRAFFVVDEFSSHGSGYASDSGDVEEKMRALLRKAAKLNAMVVAIGHDGKDVHPTVREFSHDIIWMRVVEEVGIVEADYEPTYQAGFYESVEEREPMGHRFTLDRVPETNLNYNPDEYTSWSWS